MLMLIAANIYVWTLLPLFSLFGNSYWLIRMLVTGKTKVVLADMRQTAICAAADWGNLMAQYKRFAYRFDGIFNVTGVFGMWPTWIPLPIVFFAKSLNDNCDGADVYARWLINKFNTGNGRLPQYKVKAKRAIYVPTAIKNLAHVHYITTTDNGYIFSSGHVYVPGETTPDKIAQGNLKGANYVWLRKPI